MAFLGGLPENDFGFQAFGF